MVRKAGTVIEFPHRDALKNKQCHLAGNSLLSPPCPSELLSGSL
jgi:hypothetical protein